jgi:hypothetical protein
MIDAMARPNILSRRVEAYDRGSFGHWRRENAGGWEALMRKVLPAWDADAAGRLEAWLTGAAAVDR